MGFTTQTLRKRLKVEDGIQGRTYFGALKIFYRESYVRNQIRDLLDGNMELWNERYQRLVGFIEQHGRQPSPTAEDDDERSLAIWFRNERIKMRDEKLSPEQVEKFVAIGAVPVGRREVQVSRWEDRFEQFKSFRKQHDRFPTKGSTDDDEIELARWLQEQRSRMRDQELRPERIALLQAEGVEPAEPRVSWDERYAQVLTFRKEEKRMPICRAEEGLEKSLGFWLREQAVKLRDNELTPEQAGKLTEIGVEPTRRRDWEIRWETRYRAFALFLEQNQRMPSSYSEEEAERDLKKWLDTQQHKMRDGKLTPEQEEKMKGMGVEPWGKREKPIMSWEQRYEELNRFVQQNNRLPSSYSPDEIESSLGKWVEGQRFKLRDQELGEASAQKLTALGVQSAVKRKEALGWDELYTKLEQFIKQNNKMPSQKGQTEEERTLAFWIRDQRREMQGGTINQTHLEKLQNLGVEFTANIFNKNGIGTIDGTEVVGLQRYSEMTLQIASATIFDAVEKAKLQPIGRGESKGFIVDVYRRTDIDSLEIVKMILEAKKNCLDDNGCVCIGEEEAVGLSKYAKKVLDTTGSSLQRNVDEAKLQPIGKALSGKGSYVDVYRKAEVDALETTKKALASKGNTLRSDGTVMIGEIECVGSIRYSRGLGITYSTLNKAIAKAGLQAVGMARSGKTPVDVYRKSEIDAFEVVKLAQAAVTVSPNEDGVISVGEIEGVVISRYADRVLQMSYETVMKAIERAGLESIGHTKGRNGFADIYRKAEVDALETVIQIRAGKGNELAEGVVTIGDQECISAEGYADFLEITGTTLSKAIGEAGIESVGQAMSVKRVVDVYPKTKIDALVLVQRALASKGRNLNADGVFDIDNQAEIGIDGYSAFLGIAYETLQRYIQWAGLQPIGYVRATTRIVESYRKTDVDNLPNVQQALLKRNGNGRVRGKKEEL